MSKIAMVIHGGASSASSYLKENIKDYENGLKEALLAGYKILKRGGSALKAVESAVIILEDNPLFNAGKGSALNSNGEVEMDASLMDGKNLNVGAVSMVRCVKNPIVLAKVVMTKTKHVYLSGYGALELAGAHEIKLEPEAYFVTEHQYQQFLKSRKSTHGTVGAVAYDAKGNLAAATSTGGTSNCLPGRIGDSCIIGAGCYANNNTCAVSGTGEGEALIRGVVAHTISSLVEFKKYELAKACREVIYARNKKINGEIGVIAINKKGQIAMEFNTEIMKRAWVGSDGKVQIRIYR